MENKKELNGSALNEVTGGSEWVTYQEYCPECGYVFREEKYPKGMTLSISSGTIQFCPQCQKNVNVGTRTF